MTEEHTEVQWAVAEYRMGFDILIRDSNNDPIAGVFMGGWSKKHATEHAKLIVQACNSHAANLKKIKDIKALADMGDFLEGKVDLQRTMRNIVKLCIEQET